MRTINLGTDGGHHRRHGRRVFGQVRHKATKATEATGHTSRKLTTETIDVYADPDGSHTQRLVDACWILGGPAEWRSLRRWAHMLGFGGHFLTKSRYYSVTFRLLREARAVWQRSVTTGPELDAPAEQPTVLVLNFLDFIGAGWLTNGDALLANTSAAQARKRREAARDALTYASA